MGGEYLKYGSPPGTSDLRIHLPAAREFPLSAKRAIVSRRQLSHDQLVYYTSTTSHSTDAPASARGMVDALAMRHERRQPSEWARR